MKKDDCNGSSSRRESVKRHFINTAWRLFHFHPLAFLQEYFWVSKHTGRVNKAAIIIIIFQLKGKQSQFPPPCFCVHGTMNYDQMMAFLLPSDVRHFSEVECSHRMRSHLKLLSIFLPWKIFSDDRRVNCDFIQIFALNLSDFCITECTCNQFFCVLDDRFISDDFWVTNEDDEVRLVMIYDWWTMR